MMFDSYRFRKDAWDVLLRCRENHASQEACSGGGFRFMHNPLEMFFDGVFAQIEPARDFFIGKSEHEINDDHLLAFGQVIAMLDVGVWTFELLLIQLFHDDEESAVSRERFIGNTEPTKEEPLIGGKTEPFHLEGLAILGMIAVHQTTDEVADYGMDLFGNETGAVLSGREGLQLSDKCLGFAVHEQQVPRAIEENDAGRALLLQAL